MSWKNVRGIIQRYGNIVNVLGEYARECALICPEQGAFQCLPVPPMQQVLGLHKQLRAGNLTVESKIRGLSHTLDRRSKLKVHSLLTTADAQWLRSFKPKDAICTALSSLGGENHLFLKPDQIHKLEVLHQNLPYDCRAQIYIDTHLPCSFLSDCSLLEKHKNLTSSLLISDVVDAQQFGNLPDICYVIRQSILRSWSLQEYQSNLRTTRTNSRKTTPQL